MIVKTAFLTCLLTVSFASATELKEVKLDARLLCPVSEELQSLEAVIPPAGTQSANFEEWSQNFVINLEKIIELVKSGKVRDATFGVDVKEVE
jgi:hypothetical protein